MYERMGENVRNILLRGGEKEGGEERSDVVLDCVQDGLLIVTSAIGPFEGIAGYGFKCHDEGAVDECCEIIDRRFLIRICRNLGN